MKDRIIATLGTVLLVAVTIQPAAAQRRGLDIGPVGVRGLGMFNQISEDLDEFAADAELTADQRSRIETLINEFTEQHTETLDRMTVLRDSLRARTPRAARRSEDRALIREYADLMREMRPELETFERSVGDVLTWNQGRRVASLYGPRPRVGWVARDGRRARLDRGLRRIPR